MSRRELLGPTHRRGQLMLMAVVVTGLLAVGTPAFAQAPPVAPAAPVQPAAGAIDEDAGLDEAADDAIDNIDPNSGSIVTDAVFSVAAKGAIWALKHALLGLDMQEPAVADRGGWFSNVWGMMVVVFKFAVIPLALISVIHSIAKGSMQQLLRTGAYLIVSFLGTAVAVSVVQLMLEVFDSFSYLFVRSIQDDANLFFTTVANGLTEGGIDQNALPALLGIVMSIMLMISSAVLYIILIAREATIYIATAFLPIGFATLLWPPAAKTFRHIVEIEVGMMLAKPVMVAAISLTIASVTATGALNVTPEGAPLQPDGGTTFNAALGGAGAPGGPGAPAEPGNDDDPFIVALEEAGQPGGRSFSEALANPAPEEGTPEQRASRFQWLTLTGTNIAMFVISAVAPTTVTQMVVAGLAGVAGAALASLGQRPFRATPLALAVGRAANIGNYGKSMVGSVGARRESKATAGQRLNDQVAQTMKAIGAADNGEGDWDIDPEKLKRAGLSEDQAEEIADLNDREDASGRKDATATATAQHAANIAQTYTAVNVTKDGVTYQANVSNFDRLVYTDTGVSVRKTDGTHSMIVGVADPSTGQSGLPDKRAMARMAQDQFDNGAAKVEFVVPVRRGTVHGASDQKAFDSAQAYLTENAAPGQTITLTDKIQSGNSLVDPVT